MNQIDVITIIAQFIFGFAVKYWPWLKPWPNKLIPIFNLILAILIKIAEGMVGMANADTTTMVPVAQHVSMWWGIWNVLWPAIINTAISTGTHSTLKNLGQQIVRQAAIGETK